MGCRGNSETPGVPRRAGAPMMAYARFILPSTPATVANPATLQSICDQTVAEIASVAGVHRKNQFSEPQTVATLAAASFLPKREAVTAFVEYHQP